MGLADLHTIDIVTNTDDGGECWILVARWPAVESLAAAVVSLVRDRSSR